MMVPPADADAVDAVDADDAWDHRRLLPCDCFADSAGEKAALAAGFMAKSCRHCPGKRQREGDIKRERWRRRNETRRHHQAAMTRGEGGRRVRVGMEITDVSGARGGWDEVKNLAVASTLHTHTA